MMRNQSGWMSDVGVALFDLVAGFGIFIIALLGGLSFLIKSVAGLGI